MIEPFRLLFHVHTRASFDSLMSPRTILQFCRDNDIDAVTICDHDATSGSDAAQQLAEIYGVAVIPAVEFATDAGDVIGLFVDRLPLSSEIDAVVKFIHNDCGGLAVLPHPYRGHDLDRIPLDAIDIIETHNARCAASDNLRAESLAIELGKPAIAGADAHVAGELPLALNVYEHATPPGDQTHAAIRVGRFGHDDTGLREMLMAAPREYHCNRSPARFTAMSRLIKGVKKRRPRTILNASHTLLREEAHRRLWRFGGKASSR